MAAKGIKRDQADEVARRTKERLATQTQTQNAKRDAKCKVYEITDADIDEAVDSNVALVMSHRGDLARLVAIENKLLDELDNEPTKLYISAFQGTIVEKVIGLTVTEKSATLVNLVNVRAKRIEKQRQAFNIVDTEETNKDRPLVQLAPGDELL